MGPVTVLVTSDVMQSKYQGKPNYVMLEIDGVKRRYDCENEACETFFDQQKGQTLTVEAVGRGEDAGFNLAEEGGEAPPQQPPPRSAPQQSRPAPQQRQPPPAQQQAQNQHVQPPKPDTTKSLLFARRHVARALVLQKLTLRATMALAEDWKAYTQTDQDPKGSNMPLELFQSINASLFISAERAMVKASVTQSFYEDGMPTNIDFDTLKEPEGQPQQPPPPTKPKPAPKPRQEAPPPTQTPAQPEPAEPVDDDCPF